MFEKTDTKLLERESVARRPAIAITPHCKTLPELFLTRVAKTPDNVAWKRKSGGNWIGSTWAEFYEAAASFATWLLDAKLNIGDKITIVGSTRPEWCVADMGGLLAGAVTVGAYPTLAPEQLAYILEHSDSRFIIVEDAEQLEKVLGALPRLPKVEAVLVWETRGLERVMAEEPRVRPFSDCILSRVDRARIETRVSQIDEKNTAIIVYTSGTTGPPKGAMLSNRNIVALLTGLSMIPLAEGDICLSFLPMAHAAERIVGHYVRINYGTATAYATSTSAVINELRELRPSLFGSVPRIFEKAYARIQNEVAKAPPLKQGIFRWAERVAESTVAHWQEGKPIPRTLRLQYQLADRLVYRKLRDIFGGRARFFLTGAAPIPKKILEFFWGIGFPIYEVYGMTEATAVTHMNRPGGVRLGSVGRVVDFVEEKLAPDGEILVRGDVVFQGYYKAPEATAEIIDKDGWLHTGDIGKYDRDGYLYIIDRKKHLIITAGGKNLTPSNIENEIKCEDSIISQVHAHGDRRAYVTALVSISPIEGIEWAVQKGLVERPDISERMKKALLDNPLSQPEGLDALMKRLTMEADVRRRIAEAVRRGNQKLSRVEQVKRVYILDREFSLDRDEITPTLKIKRKNVEKTFGSVFDRLYEDPSFGISVSEAAER
ncbi:AMP-dependent synthetase/ligase [Pendulispora albinea]|uniref:Long-chain fatty acid--CoA ligase n=1 Tax=Pendulispora albinea TaxID=2741071 RepID=A0ABZ2M2J4_9BACT